MDETRGAVTDCEAMDEIRTAGDASTLMAEDPAVEQTAPSAPGEVAEPLEEGTLAGYEPL